MIWCSTEIKTRQTIFYDTAPSAVCFFIFVQTVKPTRFVWLVWLTLRSSEVLRMANAFTPRSTDPGKRFLSLTCLLEVFFASSILFSEWRWSKSRRSLWMKSTSCGVSYVLFWMWEDKTSCVKSKKYLNHRRNLPTIKLSLLPRELGEVSECYRQQPKTRMLQQVCCNLETDLLSTSWYQDAFAWLATMACSRQVRSVRVLGWHSKVRRFDSHRSQTYFFLILLFIFRTLLLFWFDIYLLHVAGVPTVPGFCSRVHVPILVMS